MLAVYRESFVLSSVVVVAPRDQPHLVPISSSLLATKMVERPTFSSLDFMLANFDLARSHRALSLLSASSMPCPLSVFYVDGMLSHVMKRKGSVSSQGSPMAARSQSSFERAQHRMPGPYPPVVFATSRRSCCRPVDSVPDRYGKIIILILASPSSSHGLDCKLGRQQSVPRHRAPRSTTQSTWMSSDDCLREVNQRSLSKKAAITGRNLDISSSRCLFRARGKMPTARYAP